MAPVGMGVMRRRRSIRRRAALGRLRPCRSDRRLCRGRSIQLRPPERIAGQGTCWRPTTSSQPCSRRFMALRNLQFLRHLADLGCGRGIDAVEIAMEFDCHCFLRRQERRECRENRTRERPCLYVHIRATRRPPVGPNTCKLGHSGNCIPTWTFTRCPKMR